MEQEKNVKKSGRKALLHGEKKVPLTISVKARHKEQLRAEFIKIVKEKELQDLTAELNCG